MLAQHLTHPRIEALRRPSRDLKGLQEVARYAQEVVRRRQPKERIERLCGGVLGGAGARPYCSATAASICERGPSARWHA